MITAAQVRKARKELGESQAEFAARFGVNQSTVSRWEDAGIEGALKAMAARMVLNGLKE